ncbi:HAD-IA family hydrolase [Alphaproteobacteria bacterium LSUCC0684]
MPVVVFDLDGTLVHSAPDIAWHLNAAIAAHCESVPSLSEDDVEMLIGGGLMDLIIRGFAALDLAPDDATLDATITSYRKMYLASPVVKTTLYPGVEDMLSALKNAGYGIALCTNKSEDTAHAVLRHFDLLPMFDAVVGGDTTPTRKPDPASLLAAVERAGGVPGRAVMVGDSKADAGAAHAAGTSLILVDWGYSAVNVHDLGGDAVISSYDGFIDQVAPLAG